METYFQICQPKLGLSFMKIKCCNKLEIIQNVDNVQSVENEYERFKWAAYSTNKTCLGRFQDCGRGMS
jgi:hypothetical protein